MLGGVEFCIHQVVDLFFLFLLLVLVSAECTLFHHCRKTLGQQFVVPFFIPTFVKEKDFAG